jgi:hypothetical protein
MPVISSELPVKICKVIIATIEAYFRNGFISILFKKFAGVSYAHILNKIGKCFLGVLFKEGTKGAFGNAQREETSFKRISPLKLKNTYS